MVIMIGQWLDGWSLEGLDGRVQQTTLRSGVTGGRGFKGSGMSKCVVICIRRFGHEVLGNLYARSVDLFCVG